ncbi:glucose/galactose MFS transporter [Alkalitalea saponilacus]|uniref:Glucose/galactose transporter n=1 Tax=Alkalitalea saponilacus TaxID=889453 RepID=A0A1T5CKT3_9BACT|nr:glucose/galactose MFS transporter [Alkalitalea saponilacus]ASB49891.1 glucose/galactose MFS transporter [Alkalitalea saponilacus]SKB59760.1 glucose/galactose transporter [Alkalitalea saponilacus]
MIKKNFLIAMGIISIVFFVTGFGVGISGMLIPFLQNAFQLSNAQSYLVTAAIFSAFVIFGAPSGFILKKIGYRPGLAVAFLLMALGMFLFVPSARMLSFPMFLVALFIGGMGNTLLQTAINPYITIIGPQDSAAMRICLMGIFNKTAWWISSLFLGMFLDLSNANLADVVQPFYLITIILLVLAVFIFFAPLPEVKAEGEDEEEGADGSSYAAGKTSIFQFPHLLLGVLALFLYVGVETLPMASIVSYARMVFGHDVAVESFSVYVTLGLVLGYIFGVIAIPRFISQTKALTVFSLIGIVASLCLIMLPGEYGVYALALASFANSLMWPAIWPLAIADLGRFTKTGSSLLVMGIVGGAVLPLIFGVLVDAFAIGDAATVVDYQRAYWIFIPAYIYILYYAMKGHSIRR